MTDRWPGEDAHGPSWVAVASELCSLHGMFCARVFVVSSQDVVTVDGWCAGQRLLAQHRKQEVLASIL